MKTTGSIAAAVLFLVMGVASAQTLAPGIHVRQESQKDRIQQGMRSGELTRHEARRLWTEERGIRAEEHAFRADGSFDRTERSVVRQDLNKASRDIYRQKHDAAKRPPQPASVPTV